MASLVSARDLLFDAPGRGVLASSERGYLDSIDLLLRHHVARDPESGAVLRDGTNNDGRYTLYAPIPGPRPRWYGREFRAANDAAAVARANDLLPATLRRASKEGKRAG